MAFTQLYFGKELNSVSFTDVEQFFSEEKEESDKIEFKSYSGGEEKNHTEKQNSIVKTICALLNSAGGLIIWGAPIGLKVSNKKEKIFKGALSLVTTLIEKDTFIRIVTDSISPAPSNIFFHRVENQGHFVYLIEVAQSSYSPHQFRNIYYMRLDGQTQPAPHHYIEALFRKITFPTINLKLDQFGLNQNGGNPTYTFNGTVSIFNSSVLQNEHDVKLIIWTTLGRIDGFGMPISRTRFNDMGKKAIIDITDILHFGSPMTEYFSFQIREQELMNNKIMTLTLGVGGRRSPLRQNIYMIKIDLQSETEKAKIIESFENVTPGQTSS